MICVCTYIGVPAGGAEQPGRPEARTGRVDASIGRPAARGSARPPAHNEVEQGRRHGAHVREERA